MFGSSPIQSQCLLLKPKIVAGIQLFLSSSKLIRLTLRVVANVKITDGQIYRSDLSTKDNMRFYPDQRNVMKVAESDSLSIQFLLKSPGKKKSRASRKKAMVKLVFAP